MKKKRFNPGWPGSGGDDPRRKIREIDAKIAVLKADNRRIEEDRARTVEMVQALYQGRVVDVQDSTATEVVAGEWYIAVYCHACLLPIPLVRDLTKGQVEFGGSGALRVTCPLPECGEEGTYLAEQVVSLPVLEEGSLGGPRQQE